MYETNNDLATHGASLGGGLLGIAALPEGALTGAAY